MTSYHNQLWLAAPQIKTVGYETTNKHERLTATKESNDITDNRRMRQNQLHIHLLVMWKDDLLTKQHFSHRPGRLRWGPYSPLLLSPGRWETTHMSLILLPVEKCRKYMCRGGGWGFALTNCQGVKILPAIQRRRPRFLTWKHIDQSSAANLLLQVFQQSAQFILDPLVADLSSANTSS